MQLTMTKTFREENMPPRMRLGMERTIDEDKMRVIMEETSPTTKIMATSVTQKATKLVGWPPK